MKKLIAPSTKVVSLGILVDTVDLPLSIRAEKLQTIVCMCKKLFCTKKELHSLLGSILYVAKCINYARYFLNRMLTLLQENTQERRIKITEDFRNDLEWISSFLAVYNGVSFFNCAASKSVHLDDCLSGLGPLLTTRCVPFLSLGAGRTLI